MAIGSHMEKILQLRFSLPRWHVCVKLTKTNPCTMTRNKWPERSQACWPEMLVKRRRLAVDPTSLWLQIMVIDKKWGGQANVGARESNVLGVLGCQRYSWQKQDGAPVPHLFSLSWAVTWVNTSKAEQIYFIFFSFFGDSLPVIPTRLALISQRSACLCWDLRCRPVPSVLWMVPNQILDPKNIVCITLPWKQWDSC